MSTKSKSFFTVMLFLAVFATASAIVISNLNVSKEPIVLKKAIHI